MKFNPIELHGPWKAGCALDVHTVSSEYLGDDQFGHPQFNTIRSNVGELLYRLKYQNDKTVVKMLAESAARFIKSNNWSVDLIAAVPASQLKRRSQPVHVLARALGGALEVPVAVDCIVKVKATPELKNIYEVNERSNLLRDAYVISNQEIDEKRILVLDDLYRSGATLSAVVQSIKEQCKPKYVYALTFTKARTKQ